MHPITRLIVGGAQENTLYTASLINRSRFEVQILSGEQTGSEGSLIDEVRKLNIPLKIVPELVRQINPWLDLKAVVKMSRFMRAGSFDLVHTHSSKAGILGRIAASRAGIPVIVHTVHGWSFHDYLPAVFRWIYTWLERWAAQFSDALIVVSESDRAKGIAAKIGRPDQYHLIRSAIPVDEFNPTKIDALVVREELQIPAEAVVIGCVSRFSAQKNPLDWVRIASMVHREYPDVYFLLVGDGPLRGRLEELAELEGLSGRILLTGIRRDIPRLLAAMDLFLSTSLWEGLPRTVVQAMCMRLPVVAYEIEGVREIVQHEINGFLVPAGELAQMSICCGYLIENPESRAQMGARGANLVTEEFNLPRMISQIENLYTALLDKAH